jgi:hypothetical protein
MPWKTPAKTSRCAAQPWPPSYRSIDRSIGQELRLCCWLIDSWRWYCWLILGINSKEEDCDSDRKSVGRLCRNPLHACGSVSRSHFSNPTRFYGLAVPEFLKPSAIQLWTLVDLVTSPAYSSSLVVFDFSGILPFLQKKRHIDISNEVVHGIF